MSVAGTIGMTVDGDGSGEVVVEVTLDADAVRRVGDVEEEIRTSDLRTAGWEVDGPLAVEGGGQRLRVSHPFRTTAEAESIFRSLATEAGPFGAVEVDQRRGFWSTTTDFEGWTPARTDKCRDDRRVLIDCGLFAGLRGHRQGGARRIDGDQMRGGK